MGDNMEHNKVKRKDSRAFLRLDLKPDGVDLKSYVIEQAKIESARRGRTISATKYIQDLIIADMKAHEDAPGVDELIKQLTELGEKDPAILETLNNMAELLLKK